MIPAIHRHTRVVVDLSAIKHNIESIQQRYPEKEIFAVVKANAYGHGMLEVARVAAEAGATGFCVALLDEAIALRQAGFDQTILILGISRVEDVPLLVENHISATIGNLSWLEQALPLLKGIDARLKVHLALDTGMGRIGVTTVEAVQQVDAFLREHDDVFEFEGVFTHFAKADDADDRHLQHQVRRYQSLIGALATLPQHVHCSNTAYSLWHDALHSTVIRFGVGMYGLNPSNGVLTMPAVLSLVPALRWESEIVFVKQLHAGDTISYGATYTCESDEWIATLPVGYADGFVRAYHSGDVLVNGVRCPIVGRICMDQCMIRLPYKMPVGTPVTLLGSDGVDSISAEELSHRSGTIGYEVLCLISDRVPRIYQHSEA